MIKKLLITLAAVAFALSSVASAQVVTTGTRPLEKLISGNTIYPLVSTWTYGNDTNRIAGIYASLLDVTTLTVGGFATGNFKVAGDLFVGGGDINLGNGTATSTLTSNFGKLGVATTTPTEDFSVGGNVWISGDLKNVANITATGTTQTVGLTATGHTSLASASTTGDVSIAGNLWVNGNATTTPAGAISTQSNLDVLGNTTLTGTLGVTGLATLGNSSTTRATISDYFGVNGMATTTSEGNIATQGTLIVNGQTTLGNASTTQASADRLFVSDRSYLGTITTGTYQASTIDELYGGTGTTSPSGILKGVAGNIETAVAGTDYLVTAITGMKDQYGTTQIGATQTLATSSPDTNLGMTIVSAGDAHTFTPYWIGTLADDRIASAATWNAKLSTIGSGNVGDLSYWTGTNTLGTVATGTVSATGGITVTADRSAIGGAMAIGCTTASGSDAGCLSTTDWTAFNGKQAALVSGTNIKTVNGTTLLGSGDLGPISTQYGGTGQNFSSSNGLISLNTGVSSVVSTSTGPTGLNLDYYMKFSWPGSNQSATTTTATTTSALGVAYVPELWKGITCFTKSGTVGYEITDGTNKMDFRQASATPSNYPLVTNNTLVAEEKTFINIGPMTADVLSCTVKLTR